MDPIVHAFGATTKKCGRLLTPHHLAFSPPQPAYPIFLRLLDFLGCKVTDFLGSVSITPYGRGKRPLCIPFTRWAVCVLVGGDEVLVGDPM